MPQRPHTALPPDREPLVYFGRWCGPGWSAGRTDLKSLSDADARSAVAFAVNANRQQRASPVDLACRVHDLAYDAARREVDKVRAARAIMEADRALFSTVSRLVAQQARGGNDLNMGEVLYAKGVRIAFGLKLVADGVDLVDQLRIRAFDRAESGARSASRTALPYAVLIAFPPAAAPMLVRAKLPQRR